MVRIPSAIVGVTLALALGLLVFLAARLLRYTELVTLLLPVCSAAGGFVAARWADGTPLLPGLSVGLIAVAARVGLGLGLGVGMLAFVHPGLALLEVLAAMTGGLLGALVARRAEEPRPKTRPEYTPL
jgi:hypothetical protein